MNYLNEKRLGEILSILYRGCTIIHDKSVPNSNIRNRPDYRIDKHMIIVEFDGYNHYSTTKVIKNDNKKDLVYKSMGYRIIRIPYFIQLNAFTILKMFGISISDNDNKLINDISGKYKHGFIDKKAMLPCDFNTLGIDRFLSDLETFDYCKSDVIDSLRIKCVENNNDMELVLPDGLSFILKQED